MDEKSTYIMCLLVHLKPVEHIPTSEAVKNIYTICSSSNTIYSSASKLTKTLYSSGYHYYVLAQHYGYQCITNSHFAMYPVTDT